MRDRAQVSEQDMDDPKFWAGLYNEARMREAELVAVLRRIIRATHVHTEDCYGNYNIPAERTCGRGPYDYFDATAAGRKLLERLGIEDDR